MAGKLNTDLVRRRRQELNKQEEDRKKGQFWDKLEAGEPANRRRVLPPWSNEGHWRRKFGQHYNVLDKESVLCPKITFNEPCPICDENELLFKSKDGDEKAFAKKIRGKEAFCANVLNLNKNDGKVYVLEFGVGVEEQITKIIDPGDPIDKDGNPVEAFGYGDITDPKTGRTLQITKTVPADPMQTSYDVKPALNPTEIANWVEVEKQIHDLDAYVAEKRIYSFDDLVAMMQGTFKAKETTAPKDVVKTTAPVESKPVQDEFGQPAKTTAAVKEVDTEFVKPVGAPPVTVVQTQTEAPKPAPAVENTQPAKAMSAIERLKAIKEGKKA